LLICIRSEVAGAQRTCT